MISRDWLTVGHELPRQPGITIDGSLADGSPKPGRPGRGKVLVDIMTTAAGDEFFTSLTIDETTASMDEAAQLNPCEGVLDEFPCANAERFFFSERKPPRG